MASGPNPTARAPVRRRTRGRPHLASPVRQTRRRSAATFRRSRRSGRRRGSCGPRQPVEGTRAPLQVSRWRLEVVADERHPVRQGRRRHAPAGRFGGREARRDPIERDAEHDADGDRGERRSEPLLAEQSGLYTLSSTRMGHVEGQSIGPPGVDVRGADGRARSPSECHDSRDVSSAIDSTRGSSPLRIATP